MTRSNVCGILRLALGPVAAWLILGQPHHWKGWLLALVLLAAVSDVLDGYWSRLDGTASNWGTFLDETADKAFLGCVLVALGSRGYVPSWAVLAVLYGWFAMSGFRSFAASEGVVVRPSIGGKLSTIAVFAAVGLAILGNSLAKWAFIAGIGGGFLALGVVVLGKAEQRELLHSGLFPNKKPNL